MNNPEFAKKTVSILEEVRKTKPVVHHITNFVVMNTTANVTLAIGASPIMAHAHEEMNAMEQFSSALNLNIGTLTNYWIDSMIKAGKAAGERKIPIILDPVGAGATQMRTDATERILKEVPITVIRGNASEIMALAGEDFQIRGVDSVEAADNAREGARKLASKLDKVIAITGETDFVTNGKRHLEIKGGDPMFSNVTGTGCAATTAISCFNAAEKDTLTATAAALGYFGLAGEIAAKNSSGPGSFQVALYDALYNLKKNKILDKIIINEV